MNKKLGQDAIYDARELGIPRMLLLGLQHLFAMFGATVLVPILVSGYGLPLSIQTTLLFAGIGTLLFHVCTKFKVPAFLGSSFAFLGGFQAVANLDSGKFAAMTGEEKLPYALGGVVVAGLLKNAVGIFGMLAVLAICLTPFLNMAVQYLLYKLTAFLAGIVTQGALAELINALGTAFGLMLGMTGSCALLLLISITSAVSAVTA